MILDGKARSNLVGFNGNDGGSAAFVKEIPHNSQKNPVDLDWCGLVEDTDFFFPGDKKKRRDLIGVGGYIFKFRQQPEYPIWVDR